MPDDLTLEKLEINKRLLQIERQFDRFTAHFESEQGNWSRHMDDLIKNINKLMDSVYGANSKPGLDERSRILETKIDSISNDLKESKDARKQIFLGIVVGIALAIVNLVMTLIHK